MCTLRVELIKWLQEKGRILQSNNMTNNFSNTCSEMDKELTKKRTKSYVHEEYGDVFQVTPQL